MLPPPLSLFMDSEEDSVQVCRCTNIKYFIEIIYPHPHLKNKRLPYTLVNTIYDIWLTNAEINALLANFSPLSDLGNRRL